MDFDEVAADLSNPEVVDKYKAAADIANKAMAQVVLNAKPGTEIIQLCIAGDDVINQLCNLIYKNAKDILKGVAFPTCVSRNHILGHYSPLNSDPGQKLEQGDLVKVDLGVHIDGFIATSSHSFICTGNPQETFGGRKADVICAAHFAGECALRLCRPGYKASQMAEAINDVAAAFKCHTVEGVRSHRIERYLIAGEKAVVPKPQEEEVVDDFEFEEGEVYSIDIVMSTGEGKAKESPLRTTVFKKSDDVMYNLKLKSSRAVFAEVNKKFNNMPFTLRAFQDENKARLGITECVKHGLVRPYPVLTEKEGEFVAQFKFTVLILKGSIQKLTAHPLPFVSSDYQITEQKTLEILKMSTKRNTNKKRRRKKKAAAAKKVDAMETD